MREQQMAQQQRIHEQQEQEDDENQHQELEIDEGRGGALVEEARRLMKNDEEEDEPRADTGVSKIKMSKIGRKPTKTDPAKPAAKGREQAAASANFAKEAQQKMEKIVTSGGFSEQDIEFMKKAIQVLCQSTNPLGKSIDFVTDDIDSMNKEFDHWKRESSQCSAQLAEQQKITEDVLQPLQDQLAELEERIKEKAAKVNSIKS